MKDSSPEQLALQHLRILMRGAQRHSARIEKQCGVSGAQLWVMQELADAPGLSVGAVAARLAIHQTTASNLVDALARKHYLARSRGEHDQRVVSLTLTAAGAALIAAAPKPARGLLPEALARMSPAGLAQLNAGLAELLDAAGQQDDEQGLLPLPFTM